MLRTFLPDSVMSGKVPLTVRLSALDERHLRKTIEALKQRKLRHRVVRVLERNLRGKRDLREQPYAPSLWVFTTEKISVPL